MRSSGGKPSLHERGLRLPRQHRPSLAHVEVWGLSGAIPLTPSISTWEALGRRCRSPACGALGAPLRWVLPSGGSVSITPWPSPACGQSPADSARLPRKLRLLQANASLRGPGLLFCHRAPTHRPAGLAGSKTSSAHVFCSPTCLAECSVDI